MWQSDREAYSEEDIKNFNNVLRRLAKDIHPGWLKLLWEPKKPPQLRVLPQTPTQNRKKLLDNGNI
jgi:hypothetical protein